MSDAAELARELELLWAELVRAGGQLGLAEDEALSPTQRAALGLVVDGGACRLGALADAMGTTDATATRTVQALERLGLVERTPDAADGRGVRVAATKEGSALIAHRRRRFVRMLERAVAPDDRARLTAVLRDLRGAVAR